MPKMKSHTGTGKRVRLTGSGKLVRQKSGKRHHLEKKAVHDDPADDRHRRGRARRPQAVKRLLGK